MSFSARDSSNVLHTVLSVTDQASLSVFRDVTVQNTLQVVRSGAGQIFGGLCFNVNAAIRYLKFFDLITQPTIYEDPIFTIPLPANGLPVVLPHELCGYRFTTGIGVLATTGVGDTNTGNPSADETIVNILYSA